MIHRICHLGEDVLRQEARPVSVFDDRLLKLLDDMVETMRKAEGIGLAAPQIGVSERVVVIELGEHLFKMINPEIIESSGKDVMEEGCLSVPGIREPVARPARVKAEYQDEHGDTYEIEADGMLARAIQHEIDHLDGVLFVDRISKARRLQLKKDLELVREGKIPRREEAA